MKKIILFLILLFSLVLNAQTPQRLSISLYTPADRELITIAKYESIYFSRIVLTNVSSPILKISFPTEVGYKYSLLWTPFFLQATNMNTLVTNQLIYFHYIDALFTNSQGVIRTNHVKVNTTNGFGIFEQWRYHPQFIIGNGKINSIYDTIDCTRVYRLEITTNNPGSNTFWFPPVPH